MGKVISAWLVGLVCLFCFGLLCLDLLGFTWFYLVLLGFAWVCVALFVSFFWDWGGCVFL